MTAKSTLLDILGDTSRSTTTMRQDALKLARDRRMGIAALTKLHLETYGCYQQEPESVETAVNNLVDCALSKIREMTENDESTIATQGSSTAKPQSSNSEAEPCTTSTTNTDGIPLPDEYELNLAASSDRQLGISKTSHSATTTEDTVCVPKSLLISLLSKIDQLNSLISNQKEALLDVETRLKQEMRVREKRLTEQMEHILSLKLNESKFQSTSRRVTNIVSEKVKGKNNGRKDNQRVSVTQKEDSTDGSHRNHVQAGDAPIDGKPVTHTVLTSRDLNSPSLEPNSDTHPELESKPRPGQWHVVRNRKAAIVNLHEEKKPLGKLLGAVRVKKQVFYLGGINTECSSEDIVSFCGAVCPVTDCRIMRSNRTGTQAARIVIQENAAKTLEGLEWPEHVYLRRWNFDTSWGTRGEPQ